MQMDYDCVEFNGMRTWNPVFIVWGQIVLRLIMVTRERTVSSTIVFIHGKCSQEKKVYKFDLKHNLQSGPLHENM